MFDVALPFPGLFVELQRGCGSLEARCRLVGVVFSALEVGIRTPATAD